MKVSAPSSPLVVPAPKHSHMCISGLPPAAYLPHPPPKVRDPHRYQGQKQHLRAAGQVSHSRLVLIFPQLLRVAEQAAHLSQFFEPTLFPPPTQQGDVHPEVSTGTLTPP